MIVQSAAQGMGFKKYFLISFFDKTRETVLHSRPLFCEFFYIYTIYRRLLYDRHKEVH